MSIWIVLFACAASAALGAAAMWLIARANYSRLENENALRSARVVEFEGERDTAAAAMARAEGEIRELREQVGALSATAARVPDLETEIGQLRIGLHRLEEGKAALEATMREREAAHVEKIGALTAIRQNIESDLKALAAAALKDNQTSFLEVAQQVLQGHNAVAEKDLEKREKAIESMLQPVHQTLEEYKRNLAELEKNRQTQYGSISKELQNVLEAQALVRTEAARLVNALKAAPKTRGRWGEQQLKNALELAGMQEFVDYVTEETFEREDGRLRPDAIIRLPGSRHIVVDAKTSMAAYLEAVEAVDDVERERQLRLHSQQMRQHMRLLAAKAYWDGLTVSPDFVAMFVPGDNFFAAAMERDSQLFEDAVAARVLIVTPTTLVALAKAIAFGWRQEKVAENARHVADLGRELYKRLAQLGTHVETVGRSLERAVKSYNAMVGGLEGSVMPQARRFMELSVGTGGVEIAALEPVESDVRELRKDRDLQFVTASEGAE